MAMNPDFDTHSAQVLAHFPRLLALGIMDFMMVGPSLERLVEEIAPFGRFLQDDIRHVVDKARFPSRPSTHDDQACSVAPTLAEVVSKLDRHAKGDDYRRVSEIADGFLLLLGEPTNRQFCARLAATARKDLSRVSAASVVRALAAETGLPQVRINDLPDLVSQADEEEEEEAQSSSEEIDLAIAVRRHDTVDHTVMARRLMRDWMLVARHLIVEANYLTIGLHALAAGYYSDGSGRTIPELARQFGEELTRPIQAIERVRGNQAGDKRVREAHRQFVAEAAKKSTETLAAAAMTVQRPAGLTPDRVIVCPALPKNGPSKGKEIARGYERVLGCGLELILVPDLAIAKRTLMAEFPHCENAIDRVLRDLVGKRHVELTPLLFRGAPGVGKSRFVRRVGETLGVGVFRVDGSNDGGASFGGTERRWYSTEPSRPFMACARFEQANPLLLVDEIDKSPVRADYGRLWDAMLQFMERETAARYQDPCMQVEMDLSHVSIVATANSTDSMPGPLLDRFAAIIDVPAPTAAHLPMLAAHLGRDIAKERGWDERFVEAFDGVQLDVMRRNWRGGSIRRLRRIVETVMRGRERAARSWLN